MNVRSVIETVRELGYDTMRTDYIEKTEEIYSKIEETLDRAEVTYVVKEFPALAPEWEWELRAGEELPSLPSGLLSGEIEMNLKDSSDLRVFDFPNVSFNSHLRYFEGVSTPIFHWAPSISTSKKGVVKILEKGKVEGRLKVKVRPVSLKHVLAGNVENPKKVFVVHYDALWKGVIDNGLSVALFLNLFKERKVKEDAVLFLGFSEVTLWPKYWEYSMITAKEGFRDVLDNSEVIVVDCIGYKGTDFISDKEYIEAYSALKEEIRVFGTPMKYLLEIYHSTADDLNAISLEQLEKDVKRVMDELS